MTSTATLTSTAPDLIRKVGRLIADHGWLSFNPGARGLDLAAAARWAVHGSPCPSRDLTALEAAHMVEVLDHIAQGMKLEIPEYERERANAEPRAVSIELLAFAWVLEGELIWTDGPRRHVW